MERSKIGFIVGLNAEARLLRGTGFMVGIGGGTPGGAAEAARGLIGQGVTALVSFGLAGGLDPLLAPGDILVPRQVIDGVDRFRCDPELAAWLGGADSETLLAGTEIAVTAADKATLFARTGAAAIDLESGATARAAEAASLPFACLRAIADPAVRTLPPAALIALTGAGKISIFSILGSMLLQPGQIRALLALASDAKDARQALDGKLRNLPPFVRAGIT